MPTATRPVTLDHLKSKKKPVIRKVYIAGDDEVAEVFDDARDRRDTLKTQHRVLPDDQEIARDLFKANSEFDEAQKALRDSAILFKFRSIGRKKFDNLVSSHPATDANRQQVMDAGGDPRSLNWNHDTFSVALTAASSYEPKMTLEEVRVIFEDDEDWNSAECAALFQCALQANMDRRMVSLESLGNGSKGTNGSS